MTSSGVLRGSISLPDYEQVFVSKFVAASVFSLLIARVYTRNVQGKDDQTTNECQHIQTQP